MRKLIMIIAAAVFSAVAVSAQPRNVGGYLSLFSQGAFYQHSISESQFVQVDLGTAIIAMADERFGFHANATYNFNVLSKGEGFFNLYLAPGLGVGRDQAVLALRKKDNAGYPYDADRGVYWCAGVVTRFGVEMNFRHHMTLSIYHTPMLGVHWGHRVLRSYDVDDPENFPGLSEGDKVMAVGGVDALNFYQIIPTIAFSYRF